MAISLQDLIDAGQSIYDFAKSDVGIGLGMGATGGLLTKAAYDRLLDVGDTAKTEAQTLASDILPMTRFQPFTVTSATGGGFQVSPAVTLSPDQVASTQFIDTNQNNIDDRYETRVSLDLSPQEKLIQSSLLSSGLQDIRSGVTGALASESGGLALMGAGRRMFEQDPFGLTQQQQAAQQAFGLGGQFMGQAGMMPADVQALRQQYGQLAGQAAGDVLTPTAQREADVFERIRATQRPEEERQRLALEERLAQQGRLGVRTSMFGGTPEQLALSQAQEEAQNRASLMAMQQAQSERQQALGTAQALGGMFGQQASLAGALQAQQAGLGAQYAGLGSGLAAQRQALDAAQQQQALQSLVAGQGLLSGGLGLQQAQQQLGLQAISGAYLPQAQLLNVQQATQLFPQMQQRAQLYGAGAYGETMMSGLEAQLIAEQKAADLIGAAGTGLLSGAIKQIT